MRRILILTAILLFFLPYLQAQENDVGDGQLPAAEINAKDSQPETPAAAESEETVAVPAAGTIQHVIATHAREIPANAIAERTETMGFTVRFGIALIVIAIQALLIWLVWAKLFGFLARRAEKRGNETIKPLTIRKLKLLSTKQIIDVIKIILRLLKYLLIGFQLFITIPIVFSLFPATRNFAFTLFGYVFNPLKDIFISMVKYIPNLITIIIIVIVTRYAIRIVKFFANQITRGKLVIPGFYADWAEPTFKILQVLLWAFTLAIVYPYLPGSESKIFQGVSVFVGIIFSLGSSTAIGNLVAGLVITYMRPFRIGDRVQIKETVGIVVEKKLMVVRIKTPKNEYVTFPNMIILGSSITNYNTSSIEDSEGLILHTEITITYSTPWQTVHEILIKAALATNHVQKRPKPFVLQTGLDDFYARYQINCYTKEIEKIPVIYSILHENIQNGFKEAGIDMTSFHYEFSSVNIKEG